MSQGERFTQRWENYRPSKALWFWSCAGAIVLTMVVGFTAGGWVTGGTADEMAAQASEGTANELVASLCVDKFVTASGPTDRLAKLKEAASYKQDDFITDGGWMKIAGLSDTPSEAADICAEKLVAMDALPLAPETTAQVSDTAQASGTTESAAAPATEEGG